MTGFREVVTERQAEAPRAVEAKEPRLPPAPVPVRASETQPRREEPRAPKPTSAPNIPEERIAAQNKSEPARSAPLKEPRIQNDPSPTPSLRPEVTQPPAEIRVPIAREVIREVAQPHREMFRVPVQPDSPTPVFPALKADRNEQPNRRDRPAPAIKAQQQVRNREIPSVPAPALHTHFAMPQIEIATRDVHVTIGRVTVQATLPSAPAHAPARAPAHAGPRLTLERYLDRRGGRP